jgi:Protein of unknown function (DUF2815)
MSTTTSDATKVAFLGRARFGSPFVAKVFGQPGQSGYDPNGRKKMSMTLLVPKTDRAAIQRINAAIEAVLAAQFGSNRPARLRYPIADGDERGADGKYLRPGEEYRDHMVVALTANEDRMPVVMKGPAGQQSQAFVADYAPGYWLTVVCRAFPYDVSSQSRGCSLGTNAVNITRKDTVFAGGGDPVDDLDAALGLAGGAEAAPAEPKGPSAPVDPAAAFV